MFLLMGYICFHSRLTDGLFQVARSWLSWMPGGLAVASVGAAAGFSAVTGSSLACAAAMGRIAIPEMLRSGYDKGLASGTVAVAGTIGSMIPPSILLLVYGIYAQLPISKLFHRRRSAGHPDRGAVRRHDHREGEDQSRTRASAGAEGNLERPLRCVPRHLAGDRADRRRVRRPVRRHLHADRGRRNRRLPGLRHRLRATHPDAGKGQAGGHGDAGNDRLDLHHRHRRHSADALPGIVRIHGISSRKSSSTARSARFCSSSARWRFCCFSAASSIRSASCC